MATTRKITKAVILAAGKGTRLSPLTEDTPKILIPLSNGIPLAEYIFSWLKHYGITEIAINLHHLSEKIVNTLGDGSQYGVKLHYSYESELLGTAGGVKKLQNYLDGSFLVICGDILTNCDLNDLIDFHYYKGGIATIAAKNVHNPSAFGILELDYSQKINNFIEKPKVDFPVSYLGSIGVYVFNYQVLDYIPQDSYCDFGYDIFPKMLNNNVPMFGYILSPLNYFIDIGSPESYEQVNTDIEKRIVNTANLQLFYRPTIGTYQ